MEKTKTGLSVSLVGALAFFVALFGGYMSVLAIVGYVVLMESDAWLKRTSVKALLIVITFSAANTLIGLIPDFLSWIGTFTMLFGDIFDYTKFSLFLSIFTKALDIVKTVLLLLLAFKALKKETIRLPLVDSMLDKHM